MLCMSIEEYLGVSNIQFRVIAPPGKLFQVLVLCMALNDFKQWLTCLLLITNLLEIHTNTEPPTITCPDNITSTDPSSPNATVTIPPAICVDNSNPDHVNVSQGMEYLFPVGKGTVLFSVSDATGNVAKCKVYVVVEGLFYSVQWSYY